MKLATIVLAITLVPSIAFAEPYDAVHREPLNVHYASLGLTAGGLDAYFIGATIDGGQRVRGSWFAHAALDLGRAGSSLFADEMGTVYAGGTYVGARAGIESRHCLGDPEIVCAVGGVDLGYMHQSNPDHDPDRKDDRALVVPRAALEAGTVLRVRAGIDGLIGHDGEAGAQVSLGLGGTF